MKETLFALVPGSIFFHRYSTFDNIPRLLGLFLMEFAPYILLCLILKISVSYAFIGFFSLYAIYEFGYVTNDTVAVENENVGKTLRAQFSKFNRVKFFILRIFVVLFFLTLDLIHFHLISLNSYLLLLILAVVFFFHNRMVNRTFRIGTFVLLNTIKILVRLMIVSPEALAYLYASSPHIFVKLIHYMKTKEIIHLSDEVFSNLKPVIYLSYFLVLLMLDYKLLIFALPFALNHCKSNLLKLKDI